MIFLISITGLSFLVLIAMVVLKYFELKTGKIYAYSSILKKCDNYLEKRFFIAKAKTRKFQDNIPPLAFFGKILSQYAIKFWQKLIDYLVRFLLKIKQPAKKINTDQQRNSVSPYLRDISDNKENEN